MTSTILEIIQRNYDKFTGPNEAELHAAEEIAALFQEYIMWSTGLNSKAVVEVSFEAFIKQKPTSES